MKGVRVTVDNTKEIMKAIRMMTTENVLIGIPMEESAREGEGPINNATIGYIQENGSEAASIPPRPHLIPGVEDAAERCADLIAEGAAGVFDGSPYDLNKAYNKAGLVAVASVKNKIRSGEGFDPLSESTLENRARAGFKGTKPLIWTGQYLNSITYVIRKT